MRTRQHGGSRQKDGTTPRTGPATMTMADPPSASSSHRRAATPSTADADTPRWGRALRPRILDRSALRNLLCTGLRIRVLLCTFGLISLCTVPSGWRRRPLGCLVCGEVLERKRFGRPRRTCSTACRSKLWRRGGQRSAAAVARVEASFARVDAEACHGPDIEPARPPDVGDGPFLAQRCLGSAARVVLLKCSASISSRPSAIAWRSGVLVQLRADGTCDPALFHHRV